MKYLILFVAALMEAGGDALVRRGLGSSGLARGAFFAIGAIILFAYGYIVNAPAWEFGKVLGVYVVFFFLVAQAIAWLAFHERPGNGILLGGAFIVLGGLIISYSPA